MSKLTLATLQAYDPAPSKNGNSWRFLCPECGAGKSADDAHRCMRVEVTTGYYKCHRCNIKGKLGHEGKMLSKEEWSQIQKERHEAQERAEKERVHRWKIAKGSLLPLDGSPGEKYLLGRGIPLKVARSCQVRWASQFFGRPAVVFPQRHGVTGELIAMQARFIDNETSGGKMRMMTVGPGREALFETPGCWNQSAIYLTEAPIDAICLHMMGYPAMATCGKSLPDWLGPACKGRLIRTASDNDYFSEKNWGDEIAASWGKYFDKHRVQHKRMKPESKDWNEEWLAIQRGDL